MFNQLFLSCTGVPVCGSVELNEVITWLALTVGLASAGLMVFRRFTKNTLAATN